MIEKDKKIEELLKGHFDEPTPSLDFTNNIMDKIGAQELQAAATQFEYEPVISKKGWILIMSSFLVIVFLGLSGTKESQFNVTNYIPDFNFNLSVAHLPLVLIAVFSILALLTIDRLIMKFRLD
jgi:polyferredoxin